MQEDSEGRIEGVYTSLFLRKKEDITILVAPGSDETEVTVLQRFLRSTPVLLACRLAKQIITGKFRCASAVAIALQVVVNMRARAQEGNAMDGNERISKFLADVKDAFDET